jgi:hypothetical protein
VKGPVRALLSNPEGAADIVERDATQPQRHDLLLALGGIDLRDRSPFIAAGAHLYRGPCVS